jgi:hypothetical protein
MHHHLNICDDGVYRELVTGDWQGKWKVFGENIAQVLFCPPHIAHGLTAVQ